MSEHTTVHLTERRRRINAALLAGIGILILAIGVVRLVQTVRPMPPIVILATATPGQAIGAAKQIETFSAKPTATPEPTATPIVIRETVEVPIYVPVDAPAPTEVSRYQEMQPDPTAALEVVSWPADPTPVAAWQIR